MPADTGQVQPQLQHDAQVARAVAHAHYAAQLSGRPQRHERQQEGGVYFVDELRPRNELNSAEKLHDIFGKSNEIAQPRVLLLIEQEQFVRIATRGHGH